jgi:hypothetical protein
MPNAGFALLSHSKLGADNGAVFVVLGMPRGETTAAARLPEAASVFIGKNLPINAEDLESVLPRAGLAQNFGNDGCFAFNVTIASVLQSGSRIVIRNAADESVLLRKVFGA